MKVLHDMPVNKADVAMSDPAQNVGGIGISAPCQVRPHLRSEAALGIK